jgi:hypothetical protein
VRWGRSILLVKENSFSIRVSTAIKCPILAIFLNSTLKRDSKEKKSQIFHNQLTSEIDLIGDHVSYEVMELVESIKLKQIDFVKIVNQRLG